MNYYNPTNHTKRPSLLSRLFGKEDGAYYFTTDQKLEWKSKGQRKLEKDFSAYVNRKQKRAHRCNPFLNDDYYIITEKQWSPKTQIYIVY